MIALLVKASLTLAILWLFYKLFLERESFFSVNRFYLLGTLILCFTLPFISLPELMEDQGMIAEIIAPIEEAAPFVSPIEAEPPIAIDLFPVPTPMPEIPLLPQPTPESSSRSFGFWLLVVYFLGLLILSLRLVSQVGALLYHILVHPDKLNGIGSVIVNSHELTNPCSFFHYIFINPEQYDYDTYEQILLHEEIHVRKWHSIDLLLSEVAVILLWFNPLIWLFRKEVEKNIEYQTDDLLLKSESIRPAEYQMNLLKVATYQRPLTITTHYNHSLLKQRILKMNSKKSNPHNYWKYAFIAPALFMMLLVMNKPMVSLARLGTEAFTAPILSLAPLEEILEEEEPKTEQKGELPKVAATIPHIDEPKMEAPKWEESNVAEPQALELKMVAHKVAEPKLNTDIELPANREPVSTHKKDNGTEDLVHAVRKGDLAAVRHLISKGANINGNVYGVGTPLIVASKKGNKRMMKYLLSEGANINVNSYGVGTALIVAVKEQDWETVKFLIMQGADLNVNSYGIGTALITAQRNEDLEMIKYLFFRGANLDVDSYGIGTAMLYSVQNGDVETVKFLLANGADPDRDSHGIGSPLIAAIRRGDQHMIKFLISQRVNLNVNSFGLGTPLIVAIEKGNLNAAVSLVSKGANIDGDSYGIGTPLMVAARRGDLGMVEFLLENGAKVNKTSHGIGTALIVAIKKDQYEIVKTLLTYGAIPTQTSWGEEDAYYYAKKSHNRKILNLVKNYFREY